MKMLLMLLTFSLSLFAGDKGNGGGSYVCFDENGLPTYAQLEDFVEMQVKYKLDFDKIAEQDLEFMKILYAVGSIDKEVGDYLIQHFHEIENEFQNAMRNTIFEKAPSSNGQLENVLFPKESRYNNDGVNGCANSSLASFKTAALYDEGNLLVSSLIYNVMPQLDQKGILWHEAVFKATRILYGDTTSDYAREITAQAFQIASYENTQLLFEEIYGQQSSVLVRKEKYYKFLESLIFNSSNFKFDSIQLKESFTCRLPNYSFAYRNESDEVRTKLQNLTGHDLEFNLVENDGSQAHFKTQDEQLKLSIPTFGMMAYFLDDKFFISSALFSGDYSYITIICTK